MKKTKLCLIGCGGHAMRVYADSLAKYAATHGDVILAACCDTDPEKAEAFRRKAGFAACHTDYREMLDRERPEAVVLVTPFSITADVGVEVIGRGCHIMLEKPPGRDMADCQRLLEAVRRRSPVNMIAFNRRSAPIVRKVMELLYGGEGMKVQHIDYQMYRCRRTEAHFHTTAIHGVDMIGHIARSQYGRLEIDYRPLPQYGEGAANLLLSGSFQNGVTTQQSYCPSAGLIMERFTVAADDATLYVETPIWHGPDYPGVIKLYRRGALELVIGGETLGGQELFETDGFYDQLREFLLCVREGRQPENSIASAVDSVRIADCLASRKTHYNAQENC